MGIRARPIKANLFKAEWAVDGHPVEAKSRVFKVDGLDKWNLWVYRNLNEEDRKRKRESVDRAYRRSWKEGKRADGLIDFCFEWGFDDRG